MRHALRFALRACKIAYNITVLLFVMSAPIWLLIIMLHRYPSNYLQLAALCVPSGPEARLSFQLGKHATAVLGIRRSTTLKCLLKQVR